MEDSKQLKNFQKVGFQIIQNHIFRCCIRNWCFPIHSQKNGWKCLAIDPDKRSVNHIKEKIGINAIHGDFFEINPVKKFNIILNKVISVKEPIKMLN